MASDKNELVDTTEQETAPVRQKSDRRRNRLAAPIGMLITLFSLIGVAAVVAGGILLAVRSADRRQAVLQKEFYYFLKPVMAYNPTPFDDINVTEQDAFLNAAAYRIATTEQIRMLREHDEDCLYTVDDKGRIVVPVEDVEDSYNALFGEDSPLTHHTVSKDGVEFSDADDCYYVPFSSLEAGYRAVIDSVKKHGKTYLVRIGYVALTDIKIDEHGEEIPPVTADATYFQTYTLTVDGDGYYISACADG